MSDLLFEHDAPAFPTTQTTESRSSWDGHSYGHTFSVGGLSKRELFAAMAMQGLITGSDRFIFSLQESEEIANSAVLSADALLAELAKKEGG